MAKKLNGTVIVTYRCNARCTMCNRYKVPSKPEEEISIETIKKLNKQNGITIVLITHFMEEAVDADRVVVLDDGKIVADSTPKEIFSNIKLLKDVGLDVPQTTELLYRLKLGGMNISTDVISIEESAKKIYDAIHLEEI